MDSELRATFLCGFLCLVVLLLSGPLHSGAQSGASQSSSQLQGPDQSPGQIAGHVYRADDGEPISECLVTLEPLEYVRGTWPQEETAADGSFAFLSIAPGKYHLSAWTPNFLSKTYSGNQSASRAYTISLSPGQRIENIDVRLDRAGAISGTVFDDNNNPISGVMVLAVQPMYLPGGGAIQGGNGESTDEEGNFRVSGLRPGSYYIRAGDDRENPGHRLVYRTKYYPGTDSFENAEAIQVGGGAEISGLRIRSVTTEPAYRIDAKILDPGVGLSQRRYDLTFDSRSHNLSGSSSGTSFTLDGVPAGEYVITAWAIDPSSAENGWTVSGRGYAKIRIVDKNAQVDVPIGNGGVIKGRIIIEGSRAMSAAGTPVWLRGKGSGDVAIADQSGAFTIRDVPPGRDSFQFPILERSAYQKSVKCSGADYTAKPLEIDVGAVTDCEITLSSETATVQGHVFEDSKPMPGMVVVLIPKLGELRQIERYTRTVQTDSDGQFQLSATIPGEYFLYAVPESSDQSYCGRAQATIYVDEKEMGGATHAAQAFETEPINRVAVCSTGLYR
jgi:hypothetical protein